MATNMPEPTYTCEVCGLEGMNEEMMRDHTVNYHVEGAASCPFCEFRHESADELLLHVNAAHLDYLAPESDLIEDDDDDDDDKSDKTSEPPKPDDLDDQDINVNNNNFATSYVINNNNAVSTSDEAAAEGSPLPVELDLNLEDNLIAIPVQNGPKLQCMLCGLICSTPLELEEHINRQHFDNSSPSGSTSAPCSPADKYRCPLCDRSFPNAQDTEFHVNMEHRDVLSPAKCSTPGSLDNWNEGCPVCSRLNFESNDEMIAHIEEHFNQPTPATQDPFSDPFSDGMLAKEIDKREKESRKQREEREFELLQAQYGMDNQGNFKEQSLTNMQKAVYAGEMSVSDFYEKQIELKLAENSGIDDGSSCTKDLIPKIVAVSQLSPYVVKTLTCTAVDHYASTYGDKGWGCGYRNIQMLISSLLHHNTYNNELIKPKLLGEGLCSLRDGVVSVSTMPSICKLQQHIEWAWHLGFDVQGCEQLGGKLQNTRKWIGATEVVTVLSSLRIRCRLIDFHRPTSTDGSHPDLFTWVLEYFEKKEDFKVPLYLQHQGHSRTIVGVEQFRDGHLSLLIFDPSHTPDQMNHLHNTATAQNGMRLIRRSLSSMKAKQYQIVAVCGIIETESEYQESKMLLSTRIPQDQ